MNREEITDALGRVERRAEQVQEHNDHVLRLVRGLIAELGVKNPVLVEPPPVELPDKGEPQPPEVETPDDAPSEASDNQISGSGTLRFDFDEIANAWKLSGEGESLGRIETVGVADRRHFFCEAAVYVAGGVRLSVCRLAHSFLGTQEQEGALTFKGAGLLTEGGATLIARSDEVVIPPAQSLTVWRYEAIDDWRAGLAEPALSIHFWIAYAADVLPPINDEDDLSTEYRSILVKDLYDTVNNPQTLGPYHLAWDKEGYGHGGQGIEPDGMDWRLTPAGLALAFEVAMSTMNRMQICITDENGTPTFDPNAAYTTTHNAQLPKQYDWNPYDPQLPAYASALFEFKRIDGQHFHRVYRDLVFLAKHCPDFAPARTALRVVANWLAASSLATGFDSGYSSNQHYWSLSRKLEEIQKTPGVPSKFLGRAAMHETRCALRFLELYDRLRGEVFDGAHQMRTVLRTYIKMIVTAANENGAMYGEPASAVDHAPKSWGNALAAQPRELRLALLLMQDIERSRYVSQAAALGIFDQRDLAKLRTVYDKLYAYLGANAGAAINLETGERAGAEHWGFPLATHGIVPEGLEKLKADAASRTTEAGGSQPLNYDRRNLLDVGPRRGVSR